MLPSLLGTILAIALMFYMITEYGIKGESGWGF
jgi:hypothetical protein